MRDNATVAKLTADQPAVEADGILIEKGVTNLVLRSEDLGTTWAVIANSLNPTVGTDAIVAPDGTTTADRVTTNQATTAGGSYSLVRQQVNSLTNGGTYAFSTWVGGSGTAPATVVYINDAVVGSTGWVSCPGNGAFTRCMSTRAIASTTGYESIGWAQDTVQAASSGLLTYFWGFQLEVGAYAHAYVPTAGSSAASADDVVTITNPLEGKTSPRFCVGMTFKPTNGRTWESRSGTIALWQMGTSGSANTITAARNTSNKVLVTLLDGSSGSLVFTSATSITGTGAHRVTYCHVMGGGSLYLDGVADAGSWAGAGTGTVLLAGSITLGRLGSTASTMLDGHVASICLDTRGGSCR